MQNYLLLIKIYLSILNVIGIWSMHWGKDKFNSVENGYLNTRIIRPHFNFEDTSLRDKDIIGAPLNDEDFERAKQVTTVAHYDVSVQNRRDPIEIAGLFQGDISLNMPEYIYLKTGGSIRNAICELNMRWENGIIPYVLSNRYTNRERAMISLAVTHFTNDTCIHFKPKENETDYIHIHKGNGCSSSVGRKGGMQTVSLSSNCFFLGIIIHELMHTVGFWHEQSRYDRDSYIQIIPENIRFGLEGNFDKYGPDVIQTLGVGYDLGSIMHYGPYAFADDKSKPTIVPRKRSNIGQRQGFSKKDIIKIKLLYECPPDISAPCVDEDKNCRYWSTFGECDKNKIWMKARCRKSCSHCGPPPACKDKHLHCANWSSTGECTINPTYMLVSCPKSCGKCI